MATGLTKKQKEALTDKITGLIKNSPALRMTLDSSVNEMNINQISGELNRIHYRAIGKELPTEINIPVKQSGSGDPSPDNIRPITGYEITGIGTVYGGELNIETGFLTVPYGSVDLGSLSWSYNADYTMFVSNIIDPMSSAFTKKAICTRYTQINAWISSPTWMNGNNIYTLTGSDRRIRVKDTTYVDPDLFKAAVSGSLFVYDLETPETYTLTPQQMLQLLDQL